MQRFTLCSILLVLSARLASAQCVDWSSGFHLPGADNSVRASTTFGGSPSSPDLYVGGTFGRVNGIDARRLAKWDGASWTEAAAVGVGNPSPFVSAMTVWDDGTGPALYVGGQFSNIGGVTAASIARWDGSQWTSLGLGINGAVYCMAAFDDGSGPALYVGGAFTSAGGSSAFRLARWNGTTWSIPGVNGANGAVQALKVHDDGSGPALFVGGDFTFMGVSANYMSKWNGTTWSSMPGSFNGAVLGLESWNDGTGPGLYACGEFTQAQGVAAKVARWSGTSWSGVGGGVSVTSGTARPTAIMKFNDGSGDALYLCGEFTFAGGNPASGIAKWNGTAWSALGAGVLGLTAVTGAESLGTWNVPGAERIVVGGTFRRANGLGVEGLATWRGSWSTLGTGAGVTSRVRAITVHDDGTGPSVYIAGEFAAAGGSASTVRIGRWNGSNFAPLGSGADNTVTGLVSFNDGSGPQLFASGIFTTMGGIPALRCAKWNGTTWSSAASGLTSGVAPNFVLFDPGTGLALYDTSGYQRWNGTAWVASGWTPPIAITAAATVQEPGGLFLYISGTRMVNMVVERRVAKFDGTTWTLLPGFFDAEPNRLCGFDDGTGNALHAFGTFKLVDGSPTASAAKWTGSAWAPLGSGLLGPSNSFGDVRCTAVVPAWPGNPARIYVGGAFLTAGGNSAPYLASWDGATWSDVAGSMSDADVVETLCVEHPTGNAELWVGGLFKRAANKSSYYIARYSRTCTTSTAYCSGDGTDAACPCGNPGSTGRGCDNTAATGGAALTSSGLASISADALVMTATNAIPFGPGLYYEGSATANPSAPFGTVFGNGLRCAGGATNRLEIRFADGAGTSSTSVSLAAFGAAVAGSTYNYQLWYRDTGNVGTCTPGAGFNFSNARTLTWSP